VIEKGSAKLVLRFKQQLTQHDVMKGLIKNNFGNFVIAKLLQALPPKEVVEVQAAIEATLQYVSDKQLKQKWVQLLY